MTQHKAQQGFVTFAQNTNDVNYLKLAYLQALNVKATQSNAQYAVLVDKVTAEQVTDEQRKVFDYVIVLERDFNPVDSDWKLANEWQVFWYTPFKETIKLESDLLFTSSIDHWWNAFRLNEIVLSTGCKNYKGQLSNVRAYRQLFDDNNLPDVYNGLMYFRHSQTAREFFDVAAALSLNWPEVRDSVLKNCREEWPSTDILYALAAETIGRERCTLPTCDFINFVHMKSRINGWDFSAPWYEAILSERDDDIIRVNNLNQYSPVHYYNKEYATDELIEYYEQRRRIS